MARRRTSVVPSSSNEEAVSNNPQNPLLSAAMRWNWKWKGYSINPARIGMRIWKTTADVTRELTKALVREIFSTAFRFADAGCAIILESLHRAGYYNARKERIRKYEEQEPFLVDFITKPLTSDMEVEWEDLNADSLISDAHDEKDEAMVTYGPPHSKKFVEQKMGSQNYRFSVSDSENTRSTGLVSRCKAKTQSRKLSSARLKKGDLAIQRSGNMNSLLTLPFPKIEEENWLHKRHESIPERKEVFSNSESDEKVEPRQSRSLLLDLTAKMGEKGLYSMSVANAFSSRQTGFFEDIQLLILTIIDETYDLSQVFGQGFFARVNAVLMTIWNSRELVSSSNIMSSLKNVQTNVKALSEAVGISRSRRVNSKDDVSFFIPVVEAMLRLIESLAGPIQDRLTQLIFGGLDDRSFHDFVLSVGYPYECFDVITEDGYILPLDRIPRKGNDSHKVVYFQHGVFDTAYAWISGTSGELATNCAFTTFNDGCDVFLGNFRGNRSMLHTNPYISSKEYWDFSLNEHARYDIWAFIERIREIKLKEGVPEDKLEITLVGHSLGGAASMAYAVWKKRLHQPHHLKKMILMSPAGYHHKIPLFCKLSGPILKKTLAKVISGVRLPSAALIAVFSKVMQDLRKVPAARDLVSFFITQLVGGDVNESAFTRIGNLTFNLLLSGTSSKLFLHFWHIYQVQRFELYDYKDPFKNWMEYGSAHPPNLLDQYHLIDIPVHFLSGEHDHLIPPEDIYVQYQALRYFHPDLAVFRCFEKASHLHFTYSQNDDLIAYLHKELA